MSSEIIIQAIKKMNGLSDDLQQQVLRFIETLDSNTSNPLAMPGMSSNLSLAPLKPNPIGQPNMTITSTAPPSARKPNHESRSRH